MTEPNNKVEFVEVKKGKPIKSAPTLINKIMLIVLIMFAVYLLIYNLNKLPAELKADPLPSDYLQCRELWNNSEDKHTLACCSTCNKLKVEYAYDIQYQSGNAIIDSCVCVDAWRQKTFFAWKN